MGRKMIFLLMCGAFCISGRASLAHPSARDGGGPSFTHNAWGPVTPTGSAVGCPVGLARAAILNTGSPRKPISHLIRFRIGLGRRRTLADNNPEPSKKFSNLPY